MKDTIELSRRKVLGSIATVGAASAAAGAGTFAAFSDTESSAGNSIEAGTLNLTPNSSGLAVQSVDDLAPGDSTSVWTWTLSNSGTIPGDHLEFTVPSITNDDDPNNGNPESDPGSVSADDFARNLWVTTLQFNGVPGGWSSSDFLTLRDNPGSIIVDNDGDGDNNPVVNLSKVSDPSGGDRTGVVHVDSNGTPTTDYAIGMVSGFNLLLGGITTAGGGTPVTYDWYAGANNEGSAPDEVWAVVEDGSSNRHLVFHAGNEGGQGDDPENDETWHTRDVGAEITGQGSPLNDNHLWFEVTESGTESLFRPSGGGLEAEYPNGRLLAVGYGRGNTGSQVVLDTYYDGLVVNDEEYELPIVSLYDLRHRGVVDDMQGLAASGSGKPFDIQFQLAEHVGNAFQHDGIDFTLQFGLAQTPNQDVL